MVVHESFSEMNKYLDKEKKEKQRALEEETRHKENKEILLNQTKILKKQTFFTELLAIGTLILAFSSFFALFSFKVDYTSNVLTIGLIIVSFVLFVICMITLIWKTYKYLMMGKQDGF